MIIFKYGSYISPVFMFVYQITSDKKYKCIKASTRESDVKFGSYSKSNFEEAFEGDKLYKGVIPSEIKIKIIKGVFERLR